MCISLLSSDIILLRDNRIFLQYSILAQLYKKCKTFCQDVDFAKEKVAITCHFLLFDRKIIKKRHISYGGDKQMILFLVISVYTIVSKIAIVLDKIA